MIVTRNEHEETALLESMHREMYDPDRHQPSVSGMVYCLTKTYYENEMVVPNADGSIPSHRSRQQLLLFASGLGLEKVLLAGQQKSEAGETEGIQWHVDHIGTDGLFYEIKSTRSSTPRDGESLEGALSEGWKRQILAYFYATGIKSGRLAVLHLMGNYAPPFPDIRVYDLVATDEEIRDNWTWIQQRWVTYAKFLKDGNAPTPFQYNMEWECKYCNWKLMCDTRQRMGV